MYVFHFLQTVLDVLEETFKGSFFLWVVFCLFVRVF